jgi:hypothetical protein
MIPKCNKCGQAYKRSVIGKNCGIKGCDGLVLEVASGAQPQSGSASATGCRDARASSNHEADSSVVVETKSDSAENGQRVKIEKALFKLDEAARIYMRENKANNWIPYSTAVSELESAAREYAKVKFSADAAPSGQRASLDNSVYTKPD